jgi:hypothetical protein
LKPFTRITFLVCLVFLSCNHEKKIQTVSNNGDQFIYKHFDATVDPEYRRNYTIKVKPGQVYFAIDSYDDILAKDSFRLSPARYNSFVTAVNDLHITYKPAFQIEACIGGQSEMLTLYAGTPKEIKGHIYYCVDNNTNLSGNVDSLLGLFKALVPGLEKRIEATEK